SNTEHKTPSARQATNLITKVQLELASRIHGHALRGANIKRIIAAVYEAISNDKLLASCTWESVVDAVVKATRAGLELYSSFGHAWLVPFYDRKHNTYQCQLIIGYKGLIALAMRNNKVASIESHLVYEKDIFSIDYGSPNVYVHKVCLDSDRGQILGAYAAIWMVTSPRPIVEWMTKEEINAIRQRSKASESGPWATDYGEMARKTVVRRILKYCPLSVEEQEAIAASDSAEFDFDSSTPQVNLSHLEQLRQHMEAKNHASLHSQSKIPSSAVDGPSAHLDAIHEQSATDRQAQVDAKLSDYGKKIINSGSASELLELVAAIKQDDTLSQDEKTELIKIAKDQWRVLQ
ncbi:MAG: recombinase RecT, partial [Candidatus Aenigmatarchaeota archaeon]